MIFIYFPTEVILDISGHPLGIFWTLKCIFSLFSSQVGLAFAPESLLSSTPSQKKQKRPNYNPVRIIPETQLTSSNSLTTSQISNPGQKKLISSQTSNDEAAPKLLRRSKGGIKCSFPDAHISDSSDSNSIDILNAQPDKYHPDVPSPHDPNDGDVNTGSTDAHKKQNSQVNTDEEEVLMECELPDTQPFQSQKSQPLTKGQPPPPKPSTDCIFPCCKLSVTLNVVSIIIYTLNCNIYIFL